MIGFGLFVCRTDNKDSSYFLASRAPDSLQRIKTAAFEVFGHLFLLVNCHLFGQKNGIHV